ncbi:hypothetical protein B0H14DRAFT_2643020 [Mycena olivaceomarginata]|nr:hypothetical protein B0H14DRAFT_2643020 [Mycena olivaceomarginata]
MCFTLVFYYFIAAVCAAWSFVCDAYQWLTGRSAEPTPATAAAPTHTELDESAATHEYRLAVHEAEVTGTLPPPPPPPPALGIVSQEKPLLENVGAAATPVQKVFSEKAKLYFLQLVVSLRTGYFVENWKISGSKNERFRLRIARYVSRKHWAWQPIPLLPGQTDFSAAVLWPHAAAAAAALQQQSAAVAPAAHVELLIPP